MKKSTIIIIVVLIIAACVYFYFEGFPTGSSGLLQTQTNADTDAEAVGTQVLGLLNQIQSLSIDTSLFSDPAYLTLQDYSVVIPPVPVGRNDPFAPLPGMPVSTAQNGTTN